MQYLLLGAPINRRVRFFQEALHATGQPEAIVVPWEEWLAGTSLTPYQTSCDLLRIESPERSLAFYRACLAEGASLMGDETGETISPTEARQLAPDGSGIRYHRQCYLGYCQLLQRIHTEWTPSPVSPHPHDIAVMSDKAQCHALFEDAQLPIPQALFVDSLEELHETMLKSGRHKVFIKLRHGSSAAGVCAYAFDGNQRRLLTSLVKTKERVVSSLRMREYTHPYDIKQVLGWVFAEGAHTEEWLPKDHIDGREFDLRIVVINQRACHIVPRVSVEGRPMTNLHFGNERGELQSVQALYTDAVWQRALDIAERAASLFPRTSSVGIDVMLTPTHGPVLIEANAFGDLLPGITWQGLSTYEAHIHAQLSSPPR